MRPFSTKILFINHCWWMTKKYIIYIKWYSFFPTRIHARFSDKQTYKESSQRQLMKSTACKLPSQMWTFSLRGYLHTVLNDCSCLCYALLTVALHQWLPTFFVSWPLQQPILAQQPPPKTQSKCNTAAYTKYVLMTLQKYNLTDFRKTT